MPRWTKLILTVLMLVTAGCTGGPKAAPAPLSDAERYRKYDQLRNDTAGIPYVVTSDFDERQDKLVIGVGTLEAKQAVQREMARLGLPESAVVIDEPKPLLSEAAPFAGCQIGTPQPDGADGRISIPGVMKPGQEFELWVEPHTGPVEITRGVDSYLECWDGSAWSTLFMLVVDQGPRIAGINIVDTLGLMGPGPETLLLPDIIPPGWYRIRKRVIVGTAQQTLTAGFEVRTP